jgi:hypothetical protein
MRYLSRESAEAKIYILKIADGMKSLSSAYKKFSRKPDADTRLTEKFILRGDTLLTIKGGSWDRGDNNIVDGVKWEKGVYQTTNGGLPVLVVITGIKPAEPLPFSKVQNEIISGYQEYLEKSWIKQLKESYPVKIDNIVFEEIRKKLANV